MGGDPRSVIALALDAGLLDLEELGGSLNLINKAGQGLPTGFYRKEDGSGAGRTAFCGFRSQVADLHAALAGERSDFAQNMSAAAPGVLCLSRGRRVRFVVVPNLLPVREEPLVMGQLLAFRGQATVQARPGLGRGRRRRRPPPSPGRR